MIGRLASLGGGGAVPAALLQPDVSFVGASGTNSTLTQGVHASSLAGDFTRFWAHSTSTAALNPPTTPPLSGVETINLSSRRVAAGGKFISGPSDTCVFDSTIVPQQSQAATYRNVITGITHKGSLSSLTASSITLPAVSGAAPGSIYQVDISFNQQDAVIDVSAFPDFAGMNCDRQSLVYLASLSYAVAGGNVPRGCHQLHRYGRRPCGHLHSDVGGYQMKFRMVSGRLQMAPTGVRMVTEGPVVETLSFVQEVSSFGFGQVAGVQRAIGMTINILAAHPDIDAFYINFFGTLRGQRVLGGVRSHTIDLRLIFPDAVPDELTYIVTAVKNDERLNSDTATVNVPEMLPLMLVAGDITLTPSADTMMMRFEIDPLPVVFDGDLIGFSFKNGDDPPYTIGLVDPDEGDESAPAAPAAADPEDPPPLPAFAVDVPFDPTLWTRQYGMLTWTAEINVAAIGSTGQGLYMDDPIDVVINQTGILAIAAGDWTLGNIVDAAPEGRVRLNITGTLNPPSGWTIWGRVTTTADPFTGADATNSRQLVPGTPWDTSTVFVVGSTVYAGIMVMSPQGVLYPAVPAAKSLVVAPTSVVAPTPVLLSGPTVTGLAGAVGGIGVTLGAAVSYSNADSIAYAWIRDAATVVQSGASYVPLAAHNNFSMRLRTIATKTGGGSITNFSASFTVQYAAPVAGSIAAAGLIIGSGAQTVDGAAGFTGSPGTYSVAATGIVGVSVNATTGVISIPTDSAQVGVVTVTKTNSGGAANVPFNVAINMTGNAAIPTIPDAAWRAREAIESDGQPEGKIRLEIDPITLPAGWALRRAFNPDVPITISAAPFGTAAIGVGYSNLSYAKDLTVYTSLWLQNNNVAPAAYYLTSVQRPIPMKGFDVVVPSPDVLMPAMSTNDRNNLIGRALTRYDYSIAGGSGTSNPWGELTPVFLAINSSGGSTPEHTATDNRLLAQLEFWCLDANCPDGNGAYQGQHQWQGAGATIIATKNGCPRVWNRLSQINRDRLETIYLAIAYGAAISQGNNHPFGVVQNRPGMRGSIGGSAPNFYCGHIGAILGLHLFYKSSTQATAKFSGFDIAAFRAQATGQGLPKLANTWNHTNGSITDAQANAMIRNWTWWNATWNINSIDSLLGRMLNGMKAATDGVNGGAGCRDAELPNQLSESGKSCKLAVGRGRKYPTTPATTFTRMCAEFDITNGVSPTIVNAAEYADLNKRSDFNYAWITLGSLMSFVTAAALSDMFVTRAAFVTLRNDVDQAIKDCNLKAAGWYSVSNISTKAQYSDFDSAKHNEFAVPQRLAGWTRVHGFLTEPTPPGPGGSVISIIGSKTISSPGNSCTAEQYLVRSVKSGKDITVRVMLPPNYATSGISYPVLYTLGGQSSPLDTFTGMSGVRSKMATKPMILVTFDADLQNNIDPSDGGDNWYVNSPVVSTSQATDFFRDELIPFIDHEYRTAGAAKRGVCGFSMGAFGTMHYIASCPERTFVFGGGMSGAYLGYTRTFNFLDPVIGTKAAYPARWAALDLETRFDTLRGAGFAFPPLLIMVGTDGDVTTGSDEFVTDVLAGSGIVYTNTHVPGGHVYATWVDMMTRTNGIVDTAWTRFSNVMWDATSSLAVLAADSVNQITNPTNGEKDWRVRDTFGAQSTGFAEFGQYVPMPGEYPGETPYAPAAGGGIRMRMYRPSPAYKTYIAGVIGAPAPEWVAGLLLSNEVAGRRFKPPFYVEWTARWSSQAKGLGGSLWLYATSDTTPTAYGAAEIDLMELGGFSGSGWQFASVHARNEAQAGMDYGAITQLDADTIAFHTYAFEHTGTVMRFYRDGVVQNILANAGVMVGGSNPTGLGAISAGTSISGAMAAWFANPEYTLRMGIGTGLSTGTDGTTPDENWMEIQSLRVYQTKP